MNTQRPRPAAWLMSVGFHALLMIVASLLSPDGSSSSSGQVERPVTIAAVTVHRQQVDYFTAGAESAKANSNSASSLADALADAGAASLPAAGIEPATLPDLDLPAPASASATTAVGAPQLSSGATAQLADRADYSQFIADEQARLKARAPAGPPGNVSVFGSAQATGHSFVFLLDRSKSMGSGGLDALRAAAQELTTALDALQPIHRFAVLAYHHEIVYLQEPRLLPATSENRQSVGKFISGLAAFGQTHHDLGLLAALALQPDAIFIMTDGGEPPPSAIELRNIIRRARQQKSTIHAIQFGYAAAAPESFLRQLAEATGGSFTYVNVRQ